MVTLFCGIVDVRESVFSIDIDANKSVDQLKNAIKAKKPNRITFYANKLQLFPAKTKDGKWLSSLANDVKKLKKGEKTDLIAALVREDLQLPEQGPVAEFLADMETPQAKQIHVLVVVPDRKKQFRGNSDRESVAVLQKLSLDNRGR